uniref:Uncharacterized protein n=1 Tax=Arundo donax TaxID=35708 RepID=A0A0A8Z4I1_ARUDO
MLQQYKGNSIPMRCRMDRRFAAASGVGCKCSAHGKLGYGGGWVDHQITHKTTSLT